MPAFIRTGLSIAFAMILIMPIGSSPSRGQQSEDAIYEVSGHRMMDTVRDLEAFGSRAYDLDNSLDVAMYISERFSGIGLEIEVQNFTVRGHSAYNVIASIDGESPGEPQYLFGAHSDSWNKESDNNSDSLLLAAPGADDDASGVAAVIEIATVMSDVTVDASIKFAVFAAEESGLNGSSCFVQMEKSNGIEYAETVILDMIGYRIGDGNYANLLMKEQTDLFAESAFEAAISHGLNITLVADTVPAEPYSDHYPFWAAGYRGLLVIERLSAGEIINPNYHTATDTSETLSEDQMVELTKALVGAITAINGHEDGGEGWHISPALLLTLFGVTMISTATLLLYRKARRS